MFHVQTAVLKAELKQLSIYQNIYWCHNNNNNILEILINLF